MTRSQLTGSALIPWQPAGHALDAGRQGPADDTLPPPPPSLTTTHCAVACTARDVRTREVGIQDIHHSIKPDEVELIRRDYAANGGWETFLEYGDPRQDILIGLLRLRKIAGGAARTHHPACP